MSIERDAMSIERDAMSIERDAMSIERDAMSMELGGGGDRRGGPAAGRGERGLHLEEDSPGSLANARFLSEASALAYLPAAAGTERFRTLLGLEATLVSVSNTQAWLATDEAHIVVAFRGTESPTTIDGLKDILLTDAMNLLVVPEGRLGHDLAAAGVGARFHKGFADAIADIWPPLVAALEQEMKRCDRPVWITGHSLGGALALYAAWLLKRRFVPVHEVCTFGAPMIGNAAASAAFNREFSGKIFRYVNGRDPVPKLPTMSLVANEFWHVDAERLVGRDPVSRLTDLLGTVAAKAAGGLLSGTLIDEAWGTLSAEVAHHSLDRYRELLRG
jgi:triacylglycerol lipase